MRYIGLTQAMYLDPLGLHVGIGANSCFETLTGQDSVSSDLDRGNADDVVGPDIEAGCLAIDSDDLVNRTWLEQESVRLIADRSLMEKSFDCAGDRSMRRTTGLHLQSARLARHERR